MKIGEFSKKYGVSRETIRFYVDKNMLLPVKRAAYYNFDERCEKDMDLILHLKQLNFTLDEIAHYLTYLRVSTKHISLMKDEMLDLFERKINELDEKITEFISAKQVLEEKLDAIKRDEVKEESSKLSK